MHPYNHTIKKACDLSQIARRAYLYKLKISYSRPGKPRDNCFIESFNAIFRKECLNTHYFENLEDARNKIGDWHIEYNYERPQKRLKGLTAIEYETKIKEIEILL